MDAAEKLVPSISEPLTWAEICERYPDQQVCVVEIERMQPRSLDFRTARVIGNGNTLREALDHARSWRDGVTEIGFRFTGQAKAAFVRPFLILDDETRNAIRYR